MAFEDRDVLMRMHPGTFYITDHDRDWPDVLVRLTRVKRPVLRDVIEQGWRQVASKALLARHGGPRSPAPAAAPSATASHRTRSGPRRSR
jgi:hypothetical protein